MIAAEKTNFPVAVMCRVVGVSRTGFYNWEHRAPSDRALTDAWLTEKIKRIHEQSRGVYGAPQDPRRATHRAQGPGRAQAGRPVDESRRYLRRHASKAVAHDDPDPRDNARDRPCRAPVPARLAERAVGRGHHPTCAPARAGCTSPPSRTLTRGRSSAGRWPPTCARRSWSTRSKMALARRRPEPGLIHHSDQGSQLRLNRSSQHRWCSVVQAIVYQCQCEGSVPSVGDDPEGVVPLRDRSG